MKVQGWRLWRWCRVTAKQRDAGRNRDEKAEGNRSPSKQRSPNLWNRKIQLNLLTTEPKQLRSFFNDLVPLDSWIFRPWKNLSIRAWRGQCGRPEQEWLHSSPGSFSWRAHTGVQGVQAELGISFNPFFFGDQQIAVDGMISHSYKSYHAFAFQVSFAGWISITWLSPTSFMRAVGDRSPPVGHVKHSQMFETRLPPKMLSFHPDPSSSFRAQLSSQALLKHGADADDGGDKASRDFVLPECVSKKDDTTSAFWVTWGMVKVWYRTLCERAVNFCAFELLSCEFALKRQIFPLF